jgi:hypothetical protein
LTPRKLALSIFFASVAINAILGIIALLVGDFGDIQGKILMTSLSVSAASVMSLAMFPARERGLLGIIPDAGVALSVAGFGLLVILVWTEFREDSFARIVGSTLTFAVTAGYASLIALATVRPKFDIVVRAAYVLAAVLSLFIVFAIWGEPSEKYWLRIMGVISILLAAATVSIPVLHRLSRAEEDELDELAVELEYEHIYMDRVPTICLNCGAPGISLAEDQTYECETCEARFRVEIPA